MILGLRDQNQGGGMSVTRRTSVGLKFLRPAFTRLQVTSGYQSIDLLYLHHP